MNSLLKGHKVQLSTAARLSVLAFAATASLASINPSDPPIDPDTCSEPVSSGVEGLELGQPGEGAFEPASADGVVNVVYGSQGAPMLAVRFAASGPAVPACASHESLVSLCSAADSCEELMGSSPEPLRTYEAPGGRVTKTLYIPLFSLVPEPGLPLELTTTLGGLTRSWRLWVAAVGEFPDAGSLDAAP